MKVLIIDRDRDAGQLLQEKLQAEGHDVHIEPVRKTALEMLNDSEFDVVVIDPAPLPSARPIALPLRWEQKSNYQYLIQLGEEDPQEAVRCGLNDVVAKPFDWANVDSVFGNALRLTEFMRHLRESEETPGGGVLTFSKRPFYKLMLAALERAHRYGEQAYLLKIRITNLADVAGRLGDIRMRELLASTTEYLAKLHRMSDFLGHTDRGEHALLLLRPAVDTEPQDAAERFSIALREYRAQAPLEERLGYEMELWALPSARILEQTRPVE